MFLDLASGLNNVVERTRRLKDLLVRMAMTKPTAALIRAVTMAPQTRTHMGGPVLMIFVVKYSSSLKPVESSSVRVTFSSISLRYKNEEKPEEHGQMISRRAPQILKRTTHSIILQTHPHLHGQPAKIARHASKTMSLKERVNQCICRVIKI